MAEDVNARVDADALAPALGEALATLAPIQREVLLLRAWAGLSPAEIAAALGISQGAVRKRLYRARAEVAERLGRYGNGPSDDAMLKTGTDDERYRRARAHAE